MNKFQKSIRVRLSNLFRSMFDQESKDIAHWRQRRALEETGLFIEQNLPQVRSFDSRYALFKFLVPLLGDREGLVCEFGVAGGKSLNFLAGLMPDRRIHGFDSFEGLPEDWRDGLAAGAFRQEKLPGVLQNVKLVPGLFNETLPAFLAENPGPALFFHIDCDLYASTKTVFELCNERIIQGTILCFDEFFNYPGWLNGEYQAFKEFADSRQLRFDYLGYSRSGTQLALRIS